MIKTQCKKKKEIILTLKFEVKVNFTTLRVLQKLVYFIVFNGNTFEHDRAEVNNIER